ncbi:MAG TPA: zf-HC2 domain-containing protein [Rhizomicrobium sp.]
MATERCREMELLIQADVYGELPAAEAARVRLHVEDCEHCARTQRRLLDLGTRLRAAPRFALPDAARDAITQRVATALRPAAPRRWSLHWPLPSWSWRWGAPFGTGFAVAACLAAFLLLPRGEALPDAVVAAHVRALQPGHLTDVLSTDEHTVKPWFDGRAPFAPPVKDLAGAGFPLVGGRLDYLAGRTAAAMVYRAGPHLVDLFAWPGTTGVPGIAAEGARDGYYFVRWSEGGMSFWAVSDLNPRELAAFVRTWRAS